MCFYYTDCSSFLVVFFSNFSTLQFDILPLNLQNTICLKIFSKIDQRLIYLGKLRQTGSILKISRIKASQHSLTFETFYRRNTIAFPFSGIAFPISAENGQIKIDQKYIEECNDIAISRFPFQDKLKASLGKLRTNWQHIENQPHMLVNILLR